MDMMTRIATLTAECLTSTWPEAAGLPTAEEIRGLLAVPPDREMGDYAFPVFRLAKALRMAPPMIAKSLCEAWNHPEVARVEPVNGYMNFFLNRTNFAKETLDKVLEMGEKYGSSDMGNGKTVCLDYSSINIAKRFHIGHLSTTMIGHSLKRIHDFLGYKTVGINHLGDWGTQFGKMIYAYKTWGNKEDVEKGGVAELVRLYVKFHEEAEKDPSLDDLGRYWFKKIEDKDEEAIAIWSWFKEITLRDTARVYAKLGVEFDSYNGEAFYNDKMDVVIDELREKNLLTISEGASVVDLEADKMPPCIILRSDGATLYATRDLAAAVYRKNTYNFDKCLYVVAYQQDLHFRQIFRVLEKMEKPWAKDCVHVSFGMISFEGQAFSTRKGRVVYLEDVLNQAMQKALDIINEKATESAYDPAYESSTENVVGNWLLIYGHLGFPEMGVAGASLATVIGQFVAFVMAFWSIMKKEGYLKLRLRDGFKPDLPLLRDIINIGLPAMIEQFLMRAGMIIYAKTVAGLGTVPFATHQVCMNIQALSFMTGQAFAVSATSLMGQSLGKRRPDMAQAYCTRTRRIGMIVAIMLTLIFILFNEELVMLYNTDPEIVELLTADLIAAFTK